MGLRIAPRGSMLNAFPSFQLALIRSKADLPETISSSDPGADLLRQCIRICFARECTNLNHKRVVRRWNGHCLPSSDEHTSELQPLIRTSYADFHLKKKNTTTTTHNTRK